MATVTVDRLWLAIIYYFAAIGIATRAPRAPAVCFDNGYCAELWFWFVSGCAAYFAVSAIIHVVQALRGISR